MGERLNIRFNRKIKLEFHGVRFTSSECRTFLQWTRGCRAVNIKENGDTLNPKMFWKCYMLIWGIFIFVRVRTLTVNK
jgi:hypothetical protein